jgi:hypothetical protein
MLKKISLTRWQVCARCYHRCSEPLRAFSAIGMRVRLGNGARRARCCGSPRQRHFKTGSFVLCASATGLCCPAFHRLQICQRLLELLLLIVSAPLARRGGLKRAAAGAARASPDNMFRGSTTVRMGAVMFYGSWSSLSCRLKDGTSSDTVKTCINSKIYWRSSSSYAKRKIGTWGGRPRGLAILATILGRGEV